MENSQDTNEPVAWQRRMRTKWMQDGEWWPWQECSQAVADDYKRAPVVNDWEYESRPLYIRPQPPRQPLTDEQINNHRLALPFDGEDLPAPWDFKQGVRAAERAHGIGGEV